MTESGRRTRSTTLHVVLATLTVLASPDGLRAGEAPEGEALPAYLRDRGTGLPTTLFGTYIRRGDLIVYPFFEYYRDGNREYKPSELGAPGETDFRGRYRASEGLLYVGYGVTENVALELEAAVIEARLDKAAEDTSALPARVKASGLGDVDAHLLWRFQRESERRPELFAFLKAALPRRGVDPLIATPDWELGLGVGVSRGFGWGTITVRAAAEFAAASTSEFDVGEYAVEYLRRLSPKWRLFAAVEGTQDEVSLLTEVQWHLSEGVFLRLNNGVGLTSKATDWEPEVGVVFCLPTRARR